METERILSGCAALKEGVIRIMEFGHTVRFTGTLDIKELGGNAGKGKFDFVRGELEPRRLRGFSTNLPSNWSVTVQRKAHETHV